MNQAPSNKLSPSWKGPATILKEIGNNNYKIIFLTTLVESAWFRHQFHGRKSNFHALVKLYARPL